MSTRYENPLVERYASPRMSALFSAETRYRTWRRIWVALAEAEHALGLPVTREQIAAMKRVVETVNIEEAERIEREVRHDVMAHVLAFGKQAPEAAGIIHLGATSCDITDNADLIIYRDAMRMVSDRLVELIRVLAQFAWRERRRACLGYTHLQAAQLTTVGKRAALWLQDFLQDAEAVQQTLQRLKFRGIRGATGTQASFLDLFKGDARKVKALEERVARAFGFRACYPVCGQTYPRKVDVEIVSVLNGIAVSVSKMTNDIRYLQSVGEIEEPFGAKQIGSSAMAYKRNPMRSERAASLARLVISLTSSPQMTAAAQFLERTLDDSANRRIVIPEAFLATDAILSLAVAVTSGLVVYPEMIARRVREALPFMATEAVLMRAVAAGRDRQAVHERIRMHAMAATAAVRAGGKNDLLERLSTDPEIGLSRSEIERLMDPRRFVGCAPQQVEEFLKQHVRPFLRRYRSYFPADHGTVKY
ncbi:MAG: adenylosuccinate lyase [bacterium]|nr:adenylosuccinate lyase [bacterium]